MSAALVRDPAVRGRVGLWGRLFGPAVYWTDVLKRNNDENNEADVLPLLARSSSWHARGLFQAPRLRSEDDALTPAALTSHEQFFNVCFAYAFNSAKVERYLVADRDIASFFCYFLAFWTAWSAGGRYASSYNNVDLAHKLFWTAYAMCVVGMLMHTGGGLGGENVGGFVAANVLLHLMLANQLATRVSPGAIKP